MSRDQKEICLYCKAWKKLNFGCGECRAAPPTIGTDGIGIWPKTGQEWWCLGFMERPIEPELDAVSTFVSIGEAATAVASKLETEA